jgi:hypothetical protein
MQSSLRARFWLETALASACASLAALTSLWRDWIEAVTGRDPDHHSGSLEWAIVGGLLLVCVAGAALARAEWRRPRAATGSGA